MKIYNLVFQSDIFQTVSPCDKNIRSLGFTPFGSSRKESWPTLDFEIADSSAPVGIFRQWFANEFMLTPQSLADDQLIGILQSDGEFLPARLEGIELPFHNITCFSDCLDPALSKWRPKIEDLPDGIEYPRFLPDRTPLGTMFRLREYPSPRYVATDPSLPAEKDFYQWYHQQGYQGLKFRLMWDSDKPDQLTRFW